MTFGRMVGGGGNRKKGGHARFGCGQAFRNLEQTFGRGKHMVWPFEALSVKAQFWPKNSGWNYNTVR